ncbi:SusC/RagA family TonB-linked outer membrane protein [Myroides odoratimimus]|uniref:SusC/RagA family TonB-linked outer membrane protein n=1 Tax=Myroides odoratimimus TaxID=76832 RepID=A0AAI8C603_9FLAO|nr:SusC/RagA family TonB-linked outer membrane protein [Myroides odoratimimus]ALU26591.1 SusC/RagA family TonB-linked outer membrane protein [Myroides odoratimimus]MDM1036930.1 SusC/RagA family TonB-linked outer membrane protein [Myroides odoratimimus]MDM1053427.1 SusC/RagA family TonB-linked outer membrane protein [Myroides odoratimimus]MDM1085992.1 SusC/RagA family TonB-linked outer membrane protein [Myroides odoratimimus]
MKTQFKTITGYRTALLLILLVGLLSCPIYAVSNDKHLFFNVSDLLQDTKQKPTIKLSGTVKDTQGNLGGVIVTVGITVVTTDLDGKYTTYITSGDKITFSMIGYKDQSIVFTGGNVLNITLSEDNSTLDEIVVNAGYYSVKDRERTGSIARVTAKDIEFQPVTNPLQAIQGRMAGVSITQNSGVPGGGFDIQIRGRNSLRTATNSLYDGNLPLYIVDGVPLLSDNMGSSNLSASIIPYSNINPLNSIAPDDIESIEILKDADATAIYGSKGANGVILITTKKGNKDKTSFTISSSTSFSKVASKMKLLNTEQFIKLREQAYVNDKVTQYPTIAYDLNGTWDKNRYTDWQKELIGNTALTNNIQLGISGGSQLSSFLITANHNKQTTVFPTNDGYTRNTFLASYNYKSKDNRLDVNISTNYAIQKNNLLQKDLTQAALSLAPNAPQLYDQDGKTNWQNGTFVNPLAQRDATYNYNTKNLILNNNVSYNIFSNTYIKLNTGITSTNFDETTLTPHTIYNPALGYTSEKSSAQKATNNSFSYVIEPQLSWLKTFQKHRINILVGSTFQSTKRNSLSINASNFTSNALISNINAAKVKNIQQTNDYQYKYVALFGRLNYNYDNKYILNLTARRDGSSRFGENNKFGNFGAIGAAWLFSNESALKDISWLNLGKLRASYGSSGSDNIGDYQYLDTYSLTNTSYDGIVGLFPSRLHNPNFSWEKTLKLEAALELTLLNNRVNSIIAWYKNKSSNQLVGIPLAATTGFYTIQDNLPATIENTGWELTLNTINIDQYDWKWTTNFNISFPKNKLVSFPDIENSAYANQYIVGKPTNIRKVYHYEGIDSQTGLYKFTDYNKDGKITASEDKQYVVELGTTYFGGLQNTLSYKNLSLDFLFQFVKQRNYNYLNSYSTIGFLKNIPIELLDLWSPENPNAQYTYPTAGSNKELNSLSTYIGQSDRAISDASYIRLKNVSFSYRLKLPKARIESLVLYIQGQNLWTYTNYFGLDPESLQNRLPPLKTYAFGMQLTF